MLRLVVCLLFALGCGSIGYYFGYSAGKSSFPATPPEPTQAALAPTPTEATRSRARTAESRARTPESAVTLGTRRLSLPLANLKSSDILDTFDHSRGGGERRHEATDIMAPRGTPVYAVDDGVVKKLFTSKPGGLTIYQYDPTEHYVYYYAHLDGYAENLREGQTLRRGDLIGYVGSTGNADPNAPHLHFAILELGPSKEWWHDTTPINPYPYLTAALNQQ